MGTRINTNVTAIMAGRNLAINSDLLSRSVQRLSSGLRINSASDDPAALAISSYLDAQIAGYNQATRNTNDATNLIKTADGALNEVHNILTTIRQLAVAASNRGASSSVDISADQSQINFALSSIDRIAKTTKFGNKFLLDGSASATGSISAGSVSVGSMSDFGLVSKGQWNAGSSVNFTNVSISSATASKFDITTSGFNGTTPALVTAANATFSGTMKINDTTYNLNEDSAVDLNRLNTIITGSGYAANINSAGHLLLTNTNGGPQVNQTVEASGLLISGAAPATVPGVPVTQGANVISFDPAIVAGTGGNLSDISQVDAHTPIAVSGTLQIDNTDAHKGFLKTYKPGTSIEQVQQDLNTEYGGNLQISVVSGSLLIQDVNDPFNVLTSTSTDFVASNAATAGVYTYTNGDTATMTLSDTSGANVMSSAHGIMEGSNVYYAFNNGLVLSSSVAPSTSGSTQLNGSMNAAGGTTTAGMSLIFQLGANNGETISQNIQSIATDQLGKGASSYVDANGSTQTPWFSSLADIDVSSFKGAQDAIAVVDKAIDDISSVRSNLGALQADTLESNTRSLSINNQNLQDTRSTLRDTDLSSEIVEYTKQQILVQAGVSALGQANQSTQALLSLLK